MGAWGPARVRTDRAHRGDQRRVLVVGRRIAGLGRPGQTALLVALGQRLRQQRRIHVPGEPFAVDEGRPGVQVEDRVGAGHKGKGGDQNLVARINAIQAQG